MGDPSIDSPENARFLLDVGGEIDSCSASLRLFGEDLDPDAITLMLGAAPTIACRKGDVTRRKVTTRVEPLGKWLLSIDHQTGSTLETLINALLDRVTSNLTVWKELTSRFRVDLFCGLNMESWNRGLSFTPWTLNRIAERGLVLGLDIYYVEDEEPC